MKVMHINYAGDFEVAYQRLFIEEGGENYYGQKYSVGVVVAGARRGISTQVLSLVGRKHDSRLEQNLSSFCFGFESQNINYKELQRKILNFAPDKVVLRTPDYLTLKFLRKCAIETLPVFADSFEDAVGPLGWLKRWLLSRELKHKCIKWVANHQIDASRSLNNLGIDASKILPYDWEHPSNPEHWSKVAAKNIESKELTLFYAGALTKPKGIFELIESIKYLDKEGRKACLRVAGNGDLEELKNVVKKLSLQSSVQFLGGLDHQTVLVEMNQADIVVVPSRHEYPEGLPMTIMEALMVHTPVIVSDHPMFVGRLSNCAAVAMFASPSPRAIASEIKKVTENFNAYKSRVEQAPNDWNLLILDLKWGQVVDSWLEGCDESEFLDMTLKDYQMSSAH